MLLGKFSCSSIDNRFEMSSPKIVSYFFLIGQIDDQPDLRNLDHIDFSLAEKCICLERNGVID